MNVRKAELFDGDLINNLERFESVQWIKIVSWHLHTSYNKRDGGNKQRNVFSSNGIAYCGGVGICCNILLAAF